jgi:DNA-binding beta-propeller fold protein YncE
MAMKTCVPLLLAALGGLLTMHAVAAATPMPDHITMNTPGFVPEGVEYDTKNERFLVGSLAEGTVFVVAVDGKLRPFIKDPELKSSVGIEVDEARDRLLVANSDSSVFGGRGAGQAKLGVYDLTSGRRLAMVDLGAVGPAEAKAHFANDLTVGPDGSVYVTDTLARVIYEVTPQYVASVFLANVFGAAERHMLNGIVYDPAGYLLVAESAAGDLYKVPLADPESFTKVTLAEPVVGADGLLWHPDGSLIVVRNDKSQLVLALKSTDDWASAHVDSKGTYSGEATTAALTQNGIYVVHPFFGDAKAMPALEHVQLR